MKTTIVTCVWCKTPFERNTWEVNKAIKKGYRPCCSDACKGKLFSHEKKASGNHSTYFKDNPNKCDELSPFRVHLKSMKCHAKKIDKKVEVTLEDLKEQWERQAGRCVFTGWLLENLETSSSHRKRPPITPNRASVDRIDSNEDYTKDNIRFVCVIAQYGKNKFTDADLWRFIEDSARNKK